MGVFLFYIIFFMSTVAPLVERDLSAR